MIKVDLVTGFLGAGKTTFIKEYAKYFMDQGLKVGILENDYGAVNVDMLLLQDLRGEKCELEMVAGGCGADCHKRRFKTKLISMAMSGYKRVIVEPSGIFDMDEFFDTLREEPLENWYEIGSVITVVDAKPQGDMSEEAAFIYNSQLANAGCVVLSKTDTASEDELASTIESLKELSQSLGCKRSLEKLTIAKDWKEYDEDDFRGIAGAGYQITDYVKKLKATDAGYDTLYSLEHGMDQTKIEEKVSELFSDEKYGDIFRIKGFFQEGEKWFELNATKEQININPIKVGQEVIIIIGYNMDKELIDKQIKLSV